jgi:hypothetical protein
VELPAPDAGDPAAPKPRASTSTATSS